MVRLFNSFYVDDLQIYAKNGKDYYFSVKQEVKKPEKEEIAKMIQQATDAMGGIVCINDLKHSGHLQIVKEVRDNLKMSPIGTIRLSINSDALEQIRKNVNFASEGAVLILDEKNQIVQGQASELRRKPISSFRQRKANLIQMQKKKYQVVYRVSDTDKMESDWYYSTKGNICRFTADSETDDQDADDRDFYQQYSFVFIILCHRTSDSGNCIGEAPGFQNEILKYVSAEKEKDEFGERNSGV